MANLPYVTAPGNVTKALDGIVTAATPERVSGDFVKTILKVPGGSGDQMTSFLKKVGFTNGDGSPSTIYKKFRNSASRGHAAAESLKFAYSPLYTRNEFMHQLSDEKLKGLIIEETGLGGESSVVGLVLACIKAIKKYADWTPSDNQDDLDANIGQPPVMAPPTLVSANDISDGQGFGMNLSYTINLNLPATSDIAVFNAIFKSLKDNLLTTKNG